MENLSNETLLRKMEMNMKTGKVNNMPVVTKLHNGAYQVSDIINGYREVMTFYAYTKREAIANFKAAMAQKKHS
jgi:hypothetical protein